VSNKYKPQQLIKFMLKFGFSTNQQTCPTINPVISINDFVGWNRSLHPNWGCMEYSKAQIAKKGYKISNYFDNQGNISNQTIQIYISQNGVNQTELQKGLSYLKYALENSIPDPIDRQKIADVIFNKLKNNQDAKGTKCN